MKSDLAEARARRRRPLAVKFALAFLGLVTFVLVVNGAVDLWLTYRDAKRAALLVQQEKATAAADLIDQFITDIESQLGWTTHAEWGRIGIDQQRYDFIRLLRQAPAITDLQFLDGSGKEQLKVSRLSPDSVGSRKDFAAEPRFAKAITDRVWFSPVYFRAGSEPYMTIAVAHAGRDTGVTVAEVNLKFIRDVVTAIRVGEAGYAFIVTSQGRLIAHPDMSLVLRDTNWSGLPQVKAALHGPEPDAGVGTAAMAEGIDGKPVLSAYAPIARLGWIVFVTLPLHEALAPLYASLIQTGALLGLGLLLAGVGGTLLARRIVVPIVRLQRGAEKLGEGDLAQRIDIKTGDEIETLAERFNLMASSIQDSHDTLEGKVDERTREVTDALEQQTATADVLKVISRSAFDLQTVLDTLTRSATSLCDAKQGVIFLRDGDLYRAEATVGGSPEFLQFLKDHPRRPGREFVAPRVALSGAVEQIPDVLEDPEFDFPDVTRISGNRAILGVPLLRNGRVEGVFVLGRGEPGAFTKRQVELVQTFADQAVIAIENVRLFEKVEARTRELAHSLDELRNTQDRLIQTEKLASLGQLTAGIAHEIKNPLNFVNNFADLSRELIDELKELIAEAGTSLDDKTRAEIGELTGMLGANLEKVVQHGRRADSIVKNMLLHSREGGGERRSVDLNAVVEESLNLAYHGARAEKPGFNITFSRVFDPSVGAMDIYPQEFTRVLLNLISNGFYAAHRKKLDGGDAAFEPSLAVSTRAFADRVEIRVRDNGTGIPDSVRAKMFNPFFTTKPAGEGTGLGLSLSHDIVVKQHGGTIDIDTKLGEFSEFVIRLPRSGAPVASPGSPS